MRHPTFPTQVGIVAIVFAAFSLPVALFLLYRGIGPDFLQSTWPAFVQYALVPTGLFALTLVAAALWTRTKLGSAPPAA